MAKNRKGAKKEEKKLAEIIFVIAVPLILLVLCLLAH